MFHRLDMTDPAMDDLLAKVAPENFYHLAAKNIDVRVPVEGPVHDAQISLLGAVKLADAARRGQGSRGAGLFLYRLPTTDLPPRSGGVPAQLLLSPVDSYRTRGPFADHPEP